MEYPLAYLGPHRCVFALPAPDPISPSIDAGEIGSAHTREVDRPAGDQAFY